MTITLELIKNINFNTKEKIKTLNNYLLENEKIDKLTNEIKYKFEDCEFDATLMLDYELTALMAIELMKKQEKK